MKSLYEQVFQYIAHNNRIKFDLSKLPKDQRIMLNQHKFLDIHHLNYKYIDENGYFDMECFMAELMFNSTLNAGWVWFDEHIFAHYKDCKNIASGSLCVDDYNQEWYYVLASLNCALIIFNRRIADGFGQVKRIDKIEILYKTNPFIDYDPANTCYRRNWDRDVLDLMINPYI